MKLKFIYVLALVGVITSCQEADKKVQLENLKKQAAELNQQITKLEAEIAAGDTSLANEKYTTVTVAPVAMQSFKNFITVQGRVDANQNISLSSEMPGLVTKINVSPGQEVSAGQILAEIDNTTLVQGIAELQNGLDFATNLYNKQKNLWDQKIGTEVQYLSAKNQKESLEKKMATMQSQLDMTRIKSPINGTVDAVDIKIGQMAAPGFPAIRVVNLSNLKVKGDVAESYASLVKKGSQVNIIFPDMRDTIHTQISYVSKVINAMTRSFTVEIDLENGALYHPNMIALLQIVDYVNEKAIVVPISTIQESDNNQIIYVANGNKVEKRIVKAGKNSNGFVEIVSGLNVGDMLITSGYQELNEGELIKSQPMELPYNSSSAAAKVGL